MRNRYGNGLRQRCGIHNTNGKKDEPDKKSAGLDGGERRVTIHEVQISMRTANTNRGILALALTLSIAAMPGLVNGQPQSLSSVNQADSSSKTELKDSIKDAKAGLSKLIETVLKGGIDSNIASTLAPVIGLSKAMPMKKQEVVTSERDNELEKRACYVIYERTENTTSDAGAKRPVCAYIVKIKHSGLDRQTRYFRINLNGRLEKAVMTQTKYEASGKAVRGSGVKTDQDINSPEVKQTFETEMNFWLKDWLKKEQKADAKKSADAAKPSPATSAL